MTQSKEEIEKTINQIITGILNGYLHSSTEPSSLVYHLENHLKAGGDKIKQFIQDKFIPKSEIESQKNDLINGQTTEPNSEYKIGFNDGLQQAANKLNSLLNKEK